MENASNKNYRTAEAIDITAPAIVHKALETERTHTNNCKNTLCSAIDTVVQPIKEIFGILTVENLKK